MNVNRHQIVLRATYLMLVCCMKSTIKHGSQSLLEAEGVMVAYRVIFIFLYGLLNMSQNLSCGTESKSMSKSFFGEQRSHKLQKIPSLTQELISAFNHKKYTSQILECQFYFSKSFLYEKQQILYSSYLITNCRIMKSVLHKTGNLQYPMTCMLLKAQKLTEHSNNCSLV